MSDDEKACVLRFDAALGLPQAEFVRTKLLAALDGGTNTIIIDSAAASEVDLSFIQLLLAARRTAKERGKALKLAAPASGALLSALQRGGFLPPDAAGPEHAFWTAAERAA